LTTITSLCTYNASAAAGVEIVSYHINVSWFSGFSMGMRGYLTLNLGCDREGPGNHLGFLEMTDGSLPQSMLFHFFKKSPHFHKAWVPHFTSNERTFTEGKEHGPPLFY